MKSFAVEIASNVKKLHSTEVEEVKKYLVGCQQAAFDADANSYSGALHEALVDCDEWIEAHLKKQ